MTTEHLKEEIRLRDAMIERLKRQLAMALEAVAATHGAGKKEAA